MMDKGATFTYRNYGADGSGYYTDNGATSVIYVKDATPLVLEALRWYSTLMKIHNM